MLGEAGHVATVRLVSVYIGRWEGRKMAALYRPYVLCIIHISCWNLHVRLLYGVVVLH